MATDGVDVALCQAGIDLLRSDALLTVYDGYVPNTHSLPYVLVYTYTEWPGGSPADALDGVSGAPVARWYCHCVGETSIAAVAVAQRVRSLFLNARLNIGLPAVNVGLVYQESATPPQRDESTGSLLMDSVAVYRLMAAT